MDSIKLWNVRIPELSGGYERRVYVYLPECYETEPDRHFPVMYMFDGQNVFFDADATYGKSWGMLPYLNTSGKEIIIVAVECNNEGHCRLEEYSPIDFNYPPVGQIKGRAEIYMQWLTGTLKPFIDKTYRTSSDREHTLLCGSSMGGLMALYGAIVYNHVFQRAACLSPSFWIDPDAVCKYIYDAEIRTDTYIYMDYGSVEMQNHEAVPTSLLKVSEALLLKNVQYTLRIVPNGVHSEASWERQIPYFMSILGI